MKKFFIFLLILVIAGVLVYVFIKNNAVEISKDEISTDTDQSFDEYPSDDTDSGELPQ